MANLPPTPAPSTEIAGKPGAITAHLESIALPPAAIASARSSVSSSSTSAANSDSSYRPISPASPEARTSSSKSLTKTIGHPRKRSSAAADLAATADDDYALPPPPTRSRKIIQMKPQTTKGKTQDQAQPALPVSQSPPKAAAAATGNGGTTASTGKKKQASASTAAGRKIARKTAHSLIERRRRSKMNEEFGVLKDMIPACAGQDMHKLAILQASIDYMRYLESCVAELKAAHKNCKPASGDRPDNLNLMPPRSEATTRSTPSENYEHDEESEDEEMLEAVPPPTVDRRYTSSTAGHSRPSTSPAIVPSATTSPLFSRPGTATQQSFSTLPSPAFLAQQQQQSARLPSLSLTSPVIQAQHAHPQSASSNQLPPIAGAAAESPKDMEDHEATASALLMLNTDRRAWSGRGMSVKDLLSSQ